MDPKKVREITAKYERLALPTDRRPKSVRDRERAKKLEKERAKKEKEDAHPDDPKLGRWKKGDQGKMSGMSACETSTCSRSGGWSHFPTEHGTYFAKEHTDYHHRVTGKHHVFYLPKGSRSAERDIVTLKGRSEYGTGNRAALAGSHHARMMKKRGK